MRRLQIFREFEDGFILILVRQFMEIGLSDDGDFNPSYSPLPDAQTIVSRLQGQKIVPANFNALKQFKREHHREYILNRVYALSAMKKSLCWMDVSGNEVYPDSRFNCSFQQELLRKRAYDHLVASPVGYSGQLCILALREGHEIKLAYRPKRLEVAYETNGCGYGHNSEDEDNE